MANPKIVISGISGVYPKCDSVGELAEKLFAKEDLITDISEINFSAGKLNSVSKFDSNFFGTTNEHAEYMDPMCRILLEKTFEAILDAGYNPQELRDTKTAVFVANCTSDAEVESAFGTDVRGALICERAQSFLANRISYCFGLCGPSGTVNTACSSSLYALEFARNAIKNDECKAAIVGGSNLSLAPGLIQLYKNLGITSARCKSFDDAANGFCRSEAISVIFVQRAEHARRMYAEVVHVKTNNDGYKKQSILFPSHRMQTKLINEVYTECGVPKSQLAWVEAHGTGTRVGDYQEMKSLETLCENRASPLLVGCVKSCLGHTEATSGLCSIAKVIIAMETGRIPPNLHFSTPQNGIESLLKGEMQIVTETIPWNGGYVAVNNFGIGGANAHLLLKSNAKEVANQEMTDLPRLVAVSGRTQLAVDVFLAHLRSSPINTEFTALLHRIFSVEILNHEYRGYIILDPNSESNFQQTQKVKNTKRPIWFVYPGMGSQWPGMGNQLLYLDAFKRSILRSHKILAKYGIDLMDILTNQASALLKNVLHCFVGITAVMIALTDLLVSTGINCDGVIGHSFGEILCAYADDCLTQEQALLVAYYRGIASLDKKTVDAKMLVVGLHGSEAKEKCPKSIEIACYNGCQSCTVAGPAEDIEILAESLKSKNVFAAHVFSGNIAYHTSYIWELGPMYCEYLKTVIPEPKRISPKWISSSSAKSKIAKYASPEYFANNFTSPVQFETALANVPNNAITIELAPHSILKSILNSTLNTTITNLSLMDRNTPDGVHNLLKSLGRVYNEGSTMDLSKLYPPISFPVSRGTPMISPLIRWNHEKDWHVPFQNVDSLAQLSSTSGHTIEVTYKKPEYEYLRGHVIDEKNLFPESALLKMVWDLLVEKQALLSKNGISIIFRDVHFYQRIEIPTKNSLNFNVTMTRASGNFEVTLGAEVIVDGFVEVTNERQDGIFEPVQFDRQLLKLRPEDIYKELRIRGYNYENKFQVLRESNYEGTEAIVKWDSNWVTYLDGLFQLLYYGENDHNTVASIKWLKVHIPVADFTYPAEMAVSVHANPPRLRSDFIRIAGIGLQRIARKICPEPVIQSIDFTPYFDYKNTMTMTRVTEAIMTILLENNLNSKLNIHELNVEDVHNSLSHEICEYFRIRSFYKANITIHTNGARERHPDAYPGINFTDEIFHFSGQRNTHLLVLPHSTNNLETLIKSLDSLTESGFILSREEKDQVVFNKVQGLEISAVYHTQKEKLVLWHKVLKSTYVSYVSMADSFNWIEVLQGILKGRDSARHKVIIYSHGIHSGIIGFFNCIRKETYGHNIRCFLILDSKAPPFSISNKLYSDQVKLDLAVNVHKDGQWGCYVLHKLDVGMKIPARRAILSHREINAETIELCWVQGDSAETDDLLHVHYATYPENVLDESTDAEETRGRGSLFIFSGTDKEQCSVMGVVFEDTISNVVSARDCVSWMVPEDWTLELATASIFPYLAAAITLEGRVPKESATIVIQNANSYFGTALVMVALALECTVFTVEKTTEHAQFVKKRFRQIEESFSVEKLPDRKMKSAVLVTTSKMEYYSYELANIFGCETIICQGNGRNKNCNVIETALRAGMKVQIVNLLEISRPQVERVKDIVKAISRTTLFEPLSKDFAKINVSKSRRMERSTNRKSIKEVIPEQTESTYPVISAEPKFFCSKNDCYIICGGLGGMGFELAGWLIERGARKLVLVSRTGFCDGYKTRRLGTWRRSGVLIQISVDNICSPEGVCNLLSEANKLGPVAAIFNTTLVLGDGLFENQTSDTFQTVGSSKAVATILLDRESRRLCPDLQRFVIFSSISCGYGNAGQSNYGYANSVMERICEKRRGEGLPGLAIEWAGVGDVGYMENRVSKSPGSPGTLLQPIRSCFEVMDRFLSQPVSIVTSFIVDEGRNEEHSTADSVFTTIRKVIDRSDLNLETDTTLRDIGLDSIAVTETKNILEQQFNLFMEAADVLDLRVSDLWKIESGQISNLPVKASSAQKLAVLEGFYNNLFQIMLKTLDPFQLRPVVRLPSFLHNGATNEVPIAQEKTIFILPSIEGFASVMRPLAKNIDVQVLCAQYSMTETSIRHVAGQLFLEIENRLTNEEPFHLLGYSYGGLLAMEIAYALERKGKTGFIYLIDSSPSIVERIAKVLFGNEDFRTNNLAFIRALNCGVNSKEFEDIALQQKSWLDLKNVTMDFIPDYVPHKKEHLRTILDTLRARNDDLRHYEGIRQESLRSQVFFFKPKDSLFDTQSSSHGLTEYCRTQIQEFEIDGNHFSMLKSEKLAYHIRTLYRNATHNDHK